jgi:hypothetical protein
MNIKTTCISVLACMTAVIGAQAEDSIESVVQVASVTIESTSAGLQARGTPAMAKVVLQNRSGQTITAVKVEVIGRYEDGKEVRQAVTHDLLSTLALERVGLPSPPNTTLRAGESMAILAPLPANSAGEPAKTITASVQMVALANRTTLGSSEDARLLEAGRSHETYYMQQLVDDIDTVRQSPDVRARLSSLIKERGPKVIANATERAQSEQYVSMLKSLVLPIVEDQAKLAMAARAYRARLEVLLENAVSRGKQ